MHAAVPRVIRGTKTWIARIRSGCLSAHCVDDLGFTRQRHIPMPAGTPLERVLEDSQAVVASARGIASGT